MTQPVAVQNTTPIRKHSSGPHNCRPTEITLVRKSN